MKFRILVLSLAAVLWVTGSASAVPFLDEENYWPGWENGSSDDSRDVIGIPDFTGGSYEVDAAGYLTSLTFDRAYTGISLFGVLSPGDLFIDTGNDAVWDYVVRIFNSGTGGDAGPANLDPGPGYYPVIENINLALNASSGYILSGGDNSGDWAGYGIRDDHPVALELGVGQYPGNTAYFSGWYTEGTPTINNGQFVTTYTFTFDPGLILVGPEWDFGWTLNCANDVVYDPIENSSPVPEPATMLLFGAGLIGLVGVGRTKLFKTG